MLNKLPRADYPLTLAIAFLILLGILILRSTAPTLFPLYFLYVALAIFAFIFFLQFDFEVTSLFSRFFYVASLAFLILPLFIGQVTRGTIRWIPLGPLTIQPAELVRPFILVFFADFLAQKDVDFKRAILALLLFAPVFTLIAVQPSLGVAILTLAGFIGTVVSSGINKKRFFVGFLVLLLIIPFGWQLLAPYQKARITSFFDSYQSPLGAGYNSIQSMIAVGSGEISGRGLGKGTQTQLAFLPEKQTDFIFASVSEEMGFVGAALLILVEFFLLFRLTVFMDNAVNPAARAYLTGLFFTLFAQVVIHIGMNMQLLPVTGVPLPLVSGGGSSLLSVMIGLAIAQGSVKR